MGVLRLNNGATDQDLRWSTLSSVLQNLHYNAHMVGLVLKMSVDNTNWHCGFVLEDAVTAGQANIAFERDNTKKARYSTEATGQSSTTNVTGTTDTWMVILRKSDGSASGNVQISLKNLTTNAAWLHEGGTDTVTEPIAGRTSDRLVIGHYDNTSDPFVGWIGLAAAWDFGPAGTMPTNLQVEALSANKRTSDWWTFAQGQPIFLSELTTLSAVDLAGNATAVSTSGSPTIDNTETLESWNFNGIGSTASDGTVSFVASGAAATAASGNVTPSYPAGIQADDILLCEVTSNDNVTVSFGGSGWTKKTETNNGSLLRQTIAWKRRASGDSDTNVVITHSAGGRIAARVHAFRNARRTGDPFEDAAVNTPSAAAAGTFPNVTTTVPLDMLIYALSYGNDFTTGPSISNAQGLTLTERDETEVT